MSWLPFTVGAFVSCVLLLVGACLAPDPTAGAVLAFGAGACGAFAWVGIVNMDVDRRARERARKECEP